MEPLLPGEHRLGGLLEQAHDLTRSADQLAGKYQPFALDGVRTLLRAMDSCYSIRIEGQHTLRVEIEQALRNDYSADVSACHNTPCGFIFRGFGRRRRQGVDRGSCTMPDENTGADTVQYPVAIETGTRKHAYGVVVPDLGICRLDLGTANGGPCIALRQGEADQHQLAVTGIA